VRSNEGTTNTTQTGDIDAFLAALPDGERTAFERLRQTIKVAAPDAEESINYGVPAFKYRRPLVSFGAGKNHLAFYVQSPAVMEAHRDDLQDLRHLQGHRPFRAQRATPRGAGHEAREGPHGGD